MTFSGGAVTGSVNVDVTNAQGVLTGDSNYANLDFAEAGDTINFKIALNGSTTTTQVTRRERHCRELAEDHGRRRGDATASRLPLKRR